MYYYILIFIDGLEIVIKGFDYGLMLVKIFGVKVIIVIVMEVFLIYVVVVGGVWVVFIEVSGGFEESQKELVDGILRIVKEVVDKIGVVVEVLYIFNV